ncbi:PKD domain-containing protein [Candidatus Riflebacteria bacterium]
MVTAIENALQSLANIESEEFDLTEDLTVQNVVEEVVEKVEEAAQNLTTTTTSSSTTTTTAAATTTSTTTTSTPSISLSATSTSLTTSGTTSVSVSVSGGVGNLTVALSTSAGSLSVTSGASGFSSTFTAPSSAATVTITGTVTDSNGTRQTSTLTITVTAPADTTAPTISSTSPASSTSEAFHGTVAITFDETVTNVSTETFFIRTKASGAVFNDVGNNIHGTDLTSSSSGKTWTYTPSKKGTDTFSWGNTTYVIMASSTITDSAGNPLDISSLAAASMTFVTEIATQTITGFNPWGGMSPPGVGDSEIGLLFGDDLSSSTFTGVQVFNSLSQDLAQSFALNANTKVGSVTLSAALNAVFSAGSFTVKVPQSVTDNAGNPLAATWTTTFITDDGIAPYVTAIYPPSGTVALPATGCLVYFSEDIKFAAADVSVSELVDTNNDMTVTYTGSSRRFATGTYGEGTNQAGPIVVIPLSISGTVDSGDKFAITITTGGMGVFLDLQNNAGTHTVVIHYTQP